MLGVKNAILMNHYDEIKGIIRKQINFLQNSNYTSFDPSDGLNSPLITRLGIDKKPIIARAIIKGNSIIPFNLRNCFNINKTSFDSKVLSDSIQSFLFLSQEDNNLEHEALNLGQILISDAVKVNKGIGWGLKFPYSSRYFNYKNSPNLFTTLNASYAILKLYQRTKDKKYLDVLNHVHSFICYDLGILETSNNSSYIRYYLGF